MSETSPLEEVREGLRAVCSGFDLEYWMRADRDQRFPEEFWSELGKGGWLGLVVPEAYGGQGLGMVEVTAAIEEIAAGGAGQGGALFYVLSPVFGALPVALHGTQEQKERLLPGLATGDIEFCMGLTEPDAGSNTMRMTTKADLDGDSFVVNGGKVWITGVERAHWMLLACRTSPFDPARPSFGITLLLVELPVQGLTFQPIDKMGTRFIHSNQVFLDDVRVPVENVLGEVDQGLRVLFDVLNPERIAGAAGGLGHARLALQLAVDYASHRAPFGTPIGAYQGVAFPLAQLRADLEAARLLTYRAAEQFDAGEPSGAESAMAKLLAAQVSDRAGDQALRTHGGMGYAREYHVERLVRDGKIARVGPVSEELVLAHIAQHVLGLPKSYSDMTGRPQ
jgi:acyl-CoA dehydrogenase